MRSVSHEMSAPRDNGSDTTQQLETVDDLLDAAQALARDVLRECEENRFHNEALRATIFAMLAKLIASSRATRLLIDTREFWDAKLIIRSMLDLVIDMLYLVACRFDKKLEQRVRDSLWIEWTIEYHDRLVFCAQLMGTTPDQIPGSVPAEVRSNYASASLKKKRGWRNISRKEKEREIEEAGLGVPKELLEYTIRKHGDAAAHTKMLALRTFMVRDEGTQLKFPTTQKLDLSLDNDTLLAMEPFVCLLVASDAIVDMCYLAKGLPVRVRELHQRWIEMAKQPKTTAANQASEDAEPGKENAP